MTTQEKLAMQQRVVRNVSDGTFLQTLATKLDVVIQSEIDREIDSELEEIKEDVWDSIFDKNISFEFGSQI